MCKDCVKEDSCEGCKRWKETYGENAPCADFKRRKTNGDRIRRMTDEELAAFLFTSNGCPMWVSEYSCKEDKGCHGAKGACWLDWLRQEVRTDD